MWISLGKFARPYELRTVTSTERKDRGEVGGEGRGGRGRERERDRDRTFVFLRKNDSFFGSDPRSILKCLMKGR